MLRTIFKNLTLLIIICLANSSLGQSLYFEISWKGMFSYNLSTMEIVNIISENDKFTIVDYKLSPDSTMIAALCVDPSDLNTGSCHLNTYGIGGDLLTSLYLGSNYKYRSTLFSWSPDSRQIAWLKVESYNEDIYLPAGSIMVSDALALRKQRVLAGPFKVKELYWARFDGRIYINRPAFKRKFEREVISFDPKEPQMEPVASDLYGLDFSYDERYYLFYLFEIGSALFERNTNKVIDLPNSYSSNQMVPKMVHKGTIFYSSLSWIRGTSILDLWGRRERVLWDVGSESKELLKHKFRGRIKGIDLNRNEVYYVTFRNDKTGKVIDSRDLGFELSKVSLNEFRKE